MSTEGGHWYRRDGAPCYEIAKKGGGFRSVNLRWDRGLGLVPSTTTTTQVIAKPQLEQWKVKQAILSSLTLAREDGETDDEYIARILEDSREQAKKAAEEGTRIHDALEAAFKGEDYPEQYRPHVAATQAEIARLFPGVSDWVAEKSFAHPLGFGGKVDLHSPSDGIVVDYKGKDGDFSDGKKLVYDQHWQLGSYRLGLQLPRGNVAANIFVSRTHPGKVASHLWTPQEVDQGEEIFLATLALWKLIKKYDGGWNEADNS